MKRDRRSGAEASVASRSGRPMTAAKKIGTTLLYGAMLQASGVLRDSEADNY